MSEVLHRLATKEAVDALTAAVEGLPNATQEAADAANEAAEDAIAAVASISGLLDASYGMLPIPMTEGKYINLSGETVEMEDGRPKETGTASGYAYGVIECAEGDVFTISGHGGSAGRLYGFVDEEGNILAAATSNLTYDKMIQIAPANAAWLIINTNDGRTSFQGNSYAKLHEYNPVDVLGVLPRNNVSGNNVTFTWNGNVCTVNGSSGDQNRANYFWGRTDSLPPDVIPGGKLLTHFARGGQGDVYLMIRFYEGATGGDVMYFSTDTLIDVPPQATGMTAALNVPSGKTINSQAVECYLYSFPAVPEFVRSMYDETIGRNLIDDFSVTSPFKRGVSIFKKEAGVFHLRGALDSGTSTPEFVLYRNVRAIPDCIEKGKIYSISVHAGVANIWISAYFNNGTADSKTLFRSSRPLNGEQFGTFVVPNDCTGMGITIRFDDAGENFDEDIKVYLAAQASHTERMAMTNSILSGKGETIDNIPNLIAGMNLQQTSVNGISAEKTGDNTFSLSGMRTEDIQTTFDLYRSRTAMPQGFEPGKTYTVYLKSEDASFWIVRYNGAEDLTGTTVWKSANNKHGEQSARFTLPEDGIEGMSIAIKAGYADTYNEDVTIYICEVKSDVEQRVISEVYGGQAKNGVKKMYCIGNSFMTGAVYQDYVWVTTCGYDDAIYGQIAKHLGVTEGDVTNVFHGSTGLISPHSSGTYPAFVDTIEDTDLTPYDYLLTHCNGSDLTKTLGTVNDTAESNTVAGGVVRIVEHIRESNGLCKLILLGTPPYNSNIAGENVFITPTSGGNTIDDMDELMYKLALKYHFIYISWQDLEISYHYMDFADYHEGDTGAIHANSPAVYRALGNYAAMQVSGVSSPIAISKQMKNILTD